MKKVTRRIAVLAMALVASFGVVSLPSPADADSAWTWRIAPTSGNR